jgi:hypothetical protein
MSSETDAEKIERLERANADWQAWYDRRFAIQLHGPDVEINGMRKDAPTEQRADGSDEYVPVNYVDGLIQSAAIELRRIYDQRTAGDFTFVGVLSSFITLLDAARKAAAEGGA